MIMRWENKLLYILSAMICIIALTIGYINEYYVTWVNMPEYISLIITAIILLLNILIWIRKKGKIVFKLTSTILAIALIIIVIINTYCNPYWNSVVYKYADNLSTKSSLDVISYEEYSNSKSDDISHNSLSLDCSSALSPSTIATISISEYFS